MKKCAAFIAVAALFIVACPKRLPNYDAASGTCETKLEIIASVKSEAHCDELQAVEDESNAVWLDAGLTTQRYLRDVSLAIHPESNGYSWPNPAYDGGSSQFRIIFGDSKDACPQIIGARRTIWLANDNWTDGPFCHEGAHVLRACAPMDHICIIVRSSLPDGGIKSEVNCTGWFITNQIDEKCGVAMRRIRDARDGG